MIICAFVIRFSPFIHDDFFSMDSLEYWTFSPILRRCFYCRPVKWITRNVCGDFLRRMWGLTEPFLWIQLVAEGSLSFKRGLGVSQARARLKNAEGSRI